MKGKDLKSLIQIPNEHPTNSNKDETLIEEEDVEIPCFLAIEAKRTHSNSTHVSSVNKSQEANPLITEIENNLLDIHQAMGQQDVTFQEFGILFQSIFDNILNIEAVKIFESNIGKILQGILIELDQKRSDDVHFQRLYYLLNMGIGKIRKKLLDGFFSFKKELKAENEFPRMKKINKIQKCYLPHKPAKKEKPVH